MEKMLRKGLVMLLIAAIILMMFVSSIAYATAGLELEKGHEWVTEDSSYVNGVAAGDIDEDNIMEIVTVGYFYNATLGYSEGEMDIWNWNGTDLTLEHAEYYEPTYTLSSDTCLYAVTSGNVDNDTDIEVIMTGYGTVWGIQEQGLLLVGSWNGSAFKRETITYWPGDADAETKAFDVTVCDVDYDNTTEIITVGYENTTTILGTGFHGQIAIWNITEGVLVLETSYEWLVSGDAVWRSVSIDDVDRDGESEILIVGDFFDKLLGHECAVLRICTWNGSALEWEAGKQWYTHFDTYAYDVAAGDLNSDGAPDIVTIGYQKDSEAFNAQLRIWSLKDNMLTLKLSVEGGTVTPRTFTAGQTLTISDVDNDGTNEIILGINLAVFIFPRHPNIRILSWNEETLTLEDSKDWGDAINIQDVISNDVDNDGVVEIITVGYDGGLMLTSESELGIWSISQVASSITVTLSSPGIIIGSQVTISGTVTNGTDETPIPNVKVTIESAYELGTFTPLGTIATDKSGEYTFKWIPPAAGDYTIKASWKGDFGHKAASNTTTLNVEKASSVIASTLSSYIAKVGDTLSINGTLYPAKAATITIEYATPNGTITTKPVSSDNEGVFSDVFTANQVGEWIIKASWAGDDVYATTESLPATLAVAKIKTTLSIAASSLTANIGEVVTINGTLTPGQAATVTLVYTNPNSVITKTTAASTSAGKFTDTTEFYQTGIWQVKASWSGNEEHEATESTPISLLIKKIESTLNIAASSTTANIGENVTISGTLTPAQAATITLTYTEPNGTTMAKTVTSTGTGEFTYIILATKAGIWQVKASWNGNYQYEGGDSTSVSFLARKIESTLNIAASSTTVNVGEKVTISGALMPGQSATVTLEYKMPNGTTITKTVTSTFAGIFTDTVELSQEGVWQVKASWRGTDGYEAASSSSIVATAQIVNQTTPILATAGLGLSLIALILAIAGIYVASKKKAPTPPAPPSPPPPATIEAPSPPPPPEGAT